jgi:hypothetical protein
MIPLSKANPTLSWRRCFFNTPATS